MARERIENPDKKKRQKPMSVEQSTKYLNKRFGLNINPESLRKAVQEYRNQYPNLKTEEIKVPAFYNYVISSIVGKINDEIMYGFLKSLINKVLKEDDDKGHIRTNELKKGCAETWNKEAERGGFPSGEDLEKFLKE